MGASSTPLRPHAGARKLTRRFGSLTPPHPGSPFGKLTRGVTPISVPRGAQAARSPVHARRTAPLRAPGAALALAEGPAPSLQGWAEDGQRSQEHRPQRVTTTSPK